MLLNFNLTHLNNKNIKVLSQNNPFNTTTLEYWLIQFLIDTKFTKIELKSTNTLNEKIIDFLSKVNIYSTYNLDSFSFGKLITYTFSLGLFHRIIELTDNSPYNLTENIKFGVYLEGGLINPLLIEDFTKWLPKDTNIESSNLLWQTLYINNYIRNKNNIPDITFEKFHYQKNQNTTLNLKNLSPNNLFDLKDLIIPLSNFSFPWPNDDWVKIKSRGLFHHISDEISFIIASTQYGDCFFIGETTFGDVYTLTAPISRDTLAWEKFSQLNKNDFDFILGVPKGNSFVPALLLSQKEDCKINPLTNINVENFWENEVFQKYCKRNNFLASFRDLALFLLNQTKEILTENQKTNLDELINNNYCSHDFEFSNVQTDEVLNVCSFFYKTIAHKTHCEIINPKKDSSLGFFKKNNGSHKSLTFFNPLDVIRKYQEEPKYSHLSFLNFFTESLLFTLLNSKLIFDYNLEGNLFSHWFTRDLKCFFVSEVLNLQNEYRTFIIDHKPVSTTACFRNTVPLNCWLNGRFDPRLSDGHNATDTNIDRNRTFQYAKFLRTFCKEMKEKYPEYKNYVLDIAWSDEHQSVVPIEINSINWSGPYQANMFRLCSAIAKKPFHYADIFTNLDYNFFELKNMAWEQMKKDNIIDSTLSQNDNGFNRTRKANTLTEFNHFF